MINLFQPQVGAEELDAVAGVFHDRRLGSGRRTRAFETAFAEHLGVGPDHVVFTSSGTSALHLAVETLDLQEGDEVVLSSFGLPATAEAVAGRGGRPVFSDVDRRTLNPSLEDIEATLTDRTRAVLLLHYGGRVGDVVRIAARCRELGIVLIEDGACSVASRVADTPAGTFGDLAVWSFDPGRVLVTGDGGMVYAKDPDRAARTRQLARRGLVRASSFGHGAVPGEPDLPEYGRGIVGNDLTAAIGSVQLRRLPEMVERRREIAERYDRELAGTEGLLTPPPLPEGHESTNCLYWVQLDPAIRDGVVADLLAEEIYTTPHYAPLHRVRSGDGTDEGTPGAGLPACDWAVERTVRLPLHCGLSDGEVATVIGALREAVRTRLAETAA
ncbi:DegT/DnrJ/EryC1/StrS family aminotransferase [Streptomyces sp. WAC07061]|uniref:DegT/DnrJ/EryC1/StrS family aminotransferase n=1 Tax=Streptomyces sp. WAC07061 TaxID=2487410 RepID=UPI000F76FD72|nr:DegT/DnrJ/EryC1/StrS family aminotransferase [Streptomyces sp. WAC07061]RSS49875.1 DegT/DnrJ/EryC1/StrS family aminotransferase [Streptomyces sp. WAC07061]